MLLKTGRGLVELIDENPDTPELLLRKYPQLDHETLEMFERVGRGKLLPELVLDHSPGARRVARLALPIKTQEHLYSKLIDVPKRQKDGCVTFVPKPLHKLTTVEASITIGETGDRTEIEKEAALAERERTIKQRELRYETLDGGKSIRFLDESKYDILELIATLQRLADKTKASAVKTLQSDMQHNQLRTRPEAA